MASLLLYIGVAAAFVEYLRVSVLNTRLMIDNSRLNRVIEGYASAPHPEPEVIDPDPVSDEPVEEKTAMALIRFPMRKTFLQKQRAYEFEHNHLNHMATVIMPDKNK